MLNRILALISVFSSVAARATGPSVQKASTQGTQSNLPMISNVISLAPQGRTALNCIYASSKCSVWINIKLNVKSVNCIVCFRL